MRHNKCIHLSTELFSVIEELKEKESGVGITLTTIVRPKFVVPQNVIVPLHIFDKVEIAYTVRVRRYLRTEVV